MDYVSIFVLIALGVLLLDADVAPAAMRTELLVLASAYLVHTLIVTSRTFR